MESAAQSSPGPIQCPSPQPRVYPVCALKLVGGFIHGTYGLWTVCMNHVPRRATVYSFGLGGDISFDIDLIKRGATVSAGSQAPGRHWPGTDWLRGLMPQAGTGLVLAAGGQGISGHKQSPPNLLCSTPAVLSPQLAFKEACQRHGSG